MKILLYLSLLIAFVSCGKKIEISGTVYGKYGHYINNAIVITEGFEQKGGKRHYHINQRSDVGGKFFYETTMSRVTYFELTVQSDSGGYSFNTTNADDLKDHKVVLYK